MVCASWNLHSNEESAMSCHMHSLNKSFSQDVLLVSNQTLFKAHFSIDNSLRHVLWQLPHTIYKVQKTVLVKLMLHQVENNGIKWGISSQIRLMVWFGGELVLKEKGHSLGQTQEGEIAPGLRSRGQNRKSSSSKEFPCMCHLSPYLQLAVSPICPSYTS